MLCVWFLVGGWLGVRVECCVTIILMRVLFRSLIRATMPKLT